MVASPSKHGHHSSSSSSNGNSSSGNSTNGGSIGSGSSGSTHSDRLSTAPPIGSFIKGMMMTSPSPVMDTREERVRHALIHERKRHLSPDHEMNRDGSEYFTGSLKDGSIGGNSAGGSTGGGGGGSADSIGGGGGGGRGGGGGGVGRSIGLGTCSSHSSLTTNPEINDVVTAAGGVVVAGDGGGIESTSASINPHQIHQPGPGLSPHKMMTMMKHDWSEHPIVLALLGLPRNNGTDCLDGLPLSLVTHGETSQSLHGESIPSSTSSNHVDNSHHIQSSIHSHEQEARHKERPEERLSDVDMGMNTSNPSTTRVSFQISRQVTIDSLVSPVLRSEHDYHHAIDQQKMLVGAMTVVHHGVEGGETGEGTGGEGGGGGGGIEKGGPGEGQGPGRGSGHLPTRNSTDSLVSDWSLHSNRQIFTGNRPSHHQGTSGSASGLYDNLHHTHMTHNSMMLMTTVSTSKGQDNTTTPATMIPMPSTLGGSTVSSLLVQPTPIHPQSVQPVLAQPVPIRPTSLPPYLVHSVSTHPPSVAPCSSTFSSSTSALPSRIASPAVPTSMGKSFQSPRSKRSNFIEAV